MQTYSDSTNVFLPAGYRRALQGESATHAICRCEKRVVARVTDGSHICRWVLLRLREEDKCSGSSSRPSCGH
jgi:hypothetical protein